MSDPSLIRQILVNLVSNAIKYSPSGSIVTIRSRETNDFVEVQITDNGTGLEEKEVGQLFTKFFRGRSIPGDQIKGSGLGLYLSKYFIEMHEGSIHATSQRGAGTCFTIQLPIEGGQV